MVEAVEAGIGSSFVPSRPETPMVNDQPQLPPEALPCVPCMSGALTASRQNPLAAPGWTVTSDRPIAVRMLRAFSVVRDSEALP